MPNSLFIDTEIKRDMMATNFEKLLYDAVTILKANAESASEENADG